MVAQVESQEETDPRYVLSDGQKTKFDKLVELLKEEDVFKDKV